MNGENQNDKNTNPTSEPTSVQTPEPPQEQPAEAEVAPEPAAKPANGKTASGMEPNLAGALAYILGPVSGIYFWVTEKENKFVRFHAMQAILFSAAWILISAVLGIIPVLGWLILPIINIALLVVWFVLMYKAYGNEEWELPVIGELARKQV